MAKPLTQRELELLRQVVRQAKPPREDLLVAAETNALTRSQRQELCELISHEFLRVGLQRDDEPNALGLELEALLDTINHAKLFGESV